MRFRHLRYYDRHGKMKTPVRLILFALLIWAVLAYFGGLHPKTQDVKVTVEDVAGTTQLP